MHKFVIRIMQKLVLLGYKESFTDNYDFYN